MEVNTEFMRIAEFGLNVNSIFNAKHDLQDKVHHNTMDKWFKDLEEQRIHYVQRISDKKAYDKLDIEIALIIMEYRHEKWNLEAIYNILPKVVETRDFPHDEELKAPILNEQHMINLLNKSMEEFKENVMTKIREELIEDIKLTLPKPKSDKELRTEKKDMLLSWAKIQMKFKSEAIKKWESEDETFRFKKVGLFRKEENLVKRDKYIDEYIREQIKIFEKEENDL